LKNGYTNSIPVQIDNKYDYPDGKFQMLGGKELYQTSSFSPGSLLVMDHLGLESPLGDLCFTSLLHILSILCRIIKLLAVL